MAESLRTFERGATRPSTSGAPVRDSTQSGSQRDGGARRLGAVGGRRMGAVAAGRGAAGGPALRVEPSTLPRPI